MRRIACDPPEFSSRSNSSSGGDDGGGGAEQQKEKAATGGGAFDNECFPKLMELVENLLFSFDLAK